MLDRAAVLQSLLDLFQQPRYLEIGVDEGKTFHALNAASKAAVDPAFKFSVPADTQDVKYYAVSSDGYFAAHCPPGEVFDLIYLDGLHTFEQTLRDLLNAAMHLAPDGVIVIDDILPSSYHASLPSNTDAFLVRDHLARATPALAGDNSWMGDVYKLAFFIELFMQQLSFATVADNHGQLVAWAAPRPAQAMVPRSIAHLSMLDFSATVLHRDVFRIMPFAGILQLIQA